jgi:hypothetical protein
MNGSKTGQYVTRNIIYQIKKLNKMDFKTNYQSGYPMDLQNIRNGSEITVDLCNDKPVTKGDTFDLHGLPKFTVSAIIEEREPAVATKERPNNVNHHPKGVLFYKVSGVID